jgi:hypothetical protein
MQTHELLDAANIDPSAWTCEAGVFFGKISEDDDGRDAMMADALGECGGEFFMSAQSRTDVVKELGPALIDSRFRQRGTCDHCGAWFKFGMVYRHASGAACVVGNTCAAKTMSVPDRYTLILKRAKAKADAAIQNAKMKAQALAQAAAGGFEWLYAVEHADRILIDIAAKGRQYGGLTPRQVELVQRIHSGAPNEAKLAAEARAAARLAEQAASNYMGEVGKPLTVNAEILAQTERTYTDVWPARTVFWHLMKTAEGNFVTYRGSNNLGTRGAKVAGTFTVKAHEEYKGTKQTVLQRPRKLTVTPITPPTAAPGV